MAYNTTAWSTTTGSVTSESFSYVRYKEFGLYDFSPTAGVHNPLLCTSALVPSAATDFAEDSSQFGSGTDPATTLDISADATLSFLIPCYWHIRDSIEILDSNIFATTDSSSSTTLNFHLMKYDEASDLSNGVVIADGNLITVNSEITNGSLNIITPNIEPITSGGRTILIALVENATNTDDITLNLSLKYGIL